MAKEVNYSSMIKIYPQTNYQRDSNHNLFCRTSDKRSEEVHGICIVRNWAKAKQAIQSLAMEGVMATKLMMIMKKQPFGIPLDHVSFRSCFNVSHPSLEVHGALNLWNSVWGVSENFHGSV